MSTPDPAVSLEEIKADLRLAADGGILGIKAGDHLPAALVRHCRVLLGAVERVLELADEWDGESDERYSRSRAEGTDEEAAPILEGESSAYSNCAAEVREAITSALTGEGSGDG